MSKFTQQDEEDLAKIISPRSGVLATIAGAIAVLWALVLVIVLSGIGGMIIGLLFAMLAGAISWLFGASDPREIALMWFVATSIFFGFIRFVINIKNLLDASNKKSF